MKVDVEIDLTLGLPEETEAWLRAEYGKALEADCGFTCLGDFVSGLVILFHQTHERVRARDASHLGGDGPGGTAP